MTKKECFFVWRTTWNGALRAVVTENPAESRIWLEVSIGELDPFQGEATRRFRDIALGYVVRVSQ